MSKLIFSVRLSDEVLNKIKVLSSELNISKSELIKLGVEILWKNLSETKTRIETEPNQDLVVFLHDREKDENVYNHVFSLDNNVEKIGIVEIMRAYRNKANGEKYDKRMEKYFDRLSISFKNSVDGKL